MSALGKTMDDLRQADEERHWRLASQHLRQLIRCAICAQCGDLIADEPFDLNADEKLCHERCAKIEDDET